MYIRTPRIGAVCSADPNDIQALARDFAYELRQFFKTDRDGERRRATSAAIDAFHKAGDDPDAYSTRSRTPFRSDGGQHSAVMADTVPR